MADLDALISIAEAAMTARNRLGETEHQMPRTK
jgi:hypothetical protein